jgi:2,3-dihydroxybenzoate decarboxylase
MQNTTVKKIVLEEHFALPETLDDSEGYAADGLWPQLKRRLIDFDGERLDEMDKHQIAISVLSLNAPAVQGIPNAARATTLARKANDVLAERISRHPNRFAGLAALPMQDPDAASNELNRCVRKLGFVGALVNGFSQIGDTALYYDHPRYLSFWATVEDLDVPFYLHPRDPLPSRTRDYDDHPWFEGPAWAFGVETAMHALRLMGSGLFDRYPRIQIILGHLGEGLPYSVWRLDQRLKKAPRGFPAQKTIAEYLSSNFYLTTAGNFRTQTLINAILEVGSDRILFSIDYPFQDIGKAAIWLDNASISERDRIKIGALNAINLLKLPQT